MLPTQLEFTTLIQKEHGGILAAQTSPCGGPTQVHGEGTSASAVR